MAILTAAGILALVNARLERSEVAATVNAIILLGLEDMVSRGIDIEAEETKTLTDETASYAESALTNSWKEIQVITIIDSDGNESEPLGEISWEQYKERLFCDYSAGEPDEYCRKNGYIYLSPKPDADLYPSMKISGKIYHADSTTLSLHRRFNECLTQYSCWKICETYNLSRTAEFKQGYADELNKLLGEQSTKNRTGCKYHDI